MNEWGETKQTCRNDMADGFNLLPSEFQDAKFVVFY